MSHTPQMSALQQLGLDIAGSSECLSELLSQSSLPQPSLSAGGPITYPSAGDQPEIFQQRARLAELAMQMFQLAMGPSDTLRWMLGPARMQIGMLKVINHFNIDTHVPSTGSIPIEDLAKRIQVKQDLLERILRLTFSVNIFEESPVGHIRHTALSQALPTLKAFTYLCCRNDFQNIVMSWPDAIHSSNADTETHTCKTSWQLGSGSSKAFFPTLVDEPNGMTIFGQAMRETSTSVGSNAASFIDAFDSAFLGAGPLIDVGGGTGHFAVTLANAFPNLTVIVQDLHTNEKTASETIPDTLRDRVSFQVHDFFQPQPDYTVQPKAYLLKVIVHDWPDHEAIRILKPLVPGVEKGAKIFIIDRVLPPPGLKPTVHQSLAYSADLLMFSLLDGKERSKAGIQLLLEQVDPRLKILKATQTASLDLAMLEIGF